MLQGTNIHAALPVEIKRVRRHTHNAGSIEHRTQHIWPKLPRHAHDGATWHHQHRRRPCRSYPLLSTNLPDKLRHRRRRGDNADLYSARRCAWYCNDLACPKYWSAGSCKSNFWLHLYETAVHSRGCTGHTRVGHRELARSGELKRIGRWKNRRSPSLLRDRIILCWATSRLRGCRVFRRDMLYVTSFI